MSGKYNLNTACAIQKSEQVVQKLRIGKRGWVSLGSIIIVG